MNRAPATAKLNLALVVGPLRDDGRHEVVTVLQRIDLADRVSIEPAAELRVEGFAEDTLVRAALEQLAEAADAEPRWRARIWKHVPVAAGLGGGSSDAATALRLANETLAEPLPPERLHELAAGLGADVPFFLTVGPAARHRHRHRARAARAAAGLLGRPAPAARTSASSRRPRSTTTSTAATAPPGSRNGARACAKRSPRPSARATSRRCRRTTSPPRHTRSGCSSSAPSAPT